MFVIIVCGRLLFVNNSTSWIEAKKVCESRTNSSLPYSDTRGDLDLLIREANDNKLSTVWLDVKKTVYPGGKPHWLDQTPYSMYFLLEHSKIISCSLGEVFDLSSATFFVKPKTSLYFLRLQICSDKTFVCISGYKPVDVDNEDQCLCISNIKGSLVIDACN